MRPRAGPIAFRRPPAPPAALHVPDERALFAACAGHWRSQHPLPSPEQALASSDPAERLSGVLHALYGWYSQVEPDLAVLRRDAARWSAGKGSAAARRWRQ